MTLFENFKRNRAIKSYIVKLPKILSKDYGKSEFYTPEQVSKSIERSGLVAMYGYYAISMFCTRDSFDSYHQATDELLSYDNARSEVAGDYFNGYTDFSAKHLDQASAEYSDFKFDSFADGGFDGGDGGGSSGGGDG